MMCETSNVKSETAQTFNCKQFNNNENNVKKTCEPVNL